MTSITITTELLTDLHLLKGVLRLKNLNEVIRAALKSAGYNEAFFEKMEELMKE